MAWAMGHYYQQYGPALQIFIILHKYYSPILGTTWPYAINHMGVWFEPEGGVLLSTKWPCTMDHYYQPYGPALQILLAYTISLGPLL